MEQNDRQLAERIIVPWIMLVIVQGWRQILPGENGAHLDALIPPLLAAKTEPLDDCRPDRKAKIERRAGRAVRAALKPVAESGRPIETQWLGAARLIASMTHDDLISIADGSPFDLAWAAMLDQGFGEWPGVDGEAAEAMAAAARKALEREGYYC